MVAALLLYFLLLAGAGWIFRKKGADFDAYFYAGRDLSSGWIFFTVTATWFGAAATIATVNDAVQHGFRSVWLLGVPTVTTILCFIALNKKIRKIRLTSLPQFLSRYYGPLTVRLASWLIFFYMVLLGASQLVAWGAFAGPFLGGDRVVAILAGAGIIVLYSLFGGYLSVVLTDGIQFFLLVLSLLFLLCFLGGGPFPIRPQDLLIAENLDHSLLMTLSFTLAWVISPIVWQRIASARSDRASRTGLIFSLFAFSALYAAVIVIAIFLRASPANDLPSLILEGLPKIGGILVFLGIGAAVMSTADSAINLGALTLVRDIFSARPRRTIFLSRTATLVAGILAAVIALRFQSIIKTLGLASEILAEGLFIPGMAALLIGARKPKAGLLSLCLGGIFAILVFLKAYGLALPLPPWPYSLPYGLLASAFGFGLGWMFDKKSIAPTMDGENGV